MSATIEATCTASGEGWRCHVLVEDGRTRSEHSVTVARADLERLDPGASDPGRLVRASFEFLLARESKESILRAFDLPVIGHYFPEYEAEIRKRPGGP